jgi:hypothetical protein
VWCGNPPGAGSGARARLGLDGEQLAFVLKSERGGRAQDGTPGTTPIKSVEVRKALLNWRKLLENPGEEICSYIEKEEER